MKVSVRLAMITVLLVAMITITTLCLTHPLIEKQRSSKNVPSLGIPIVFAQVPSTINNSLPPSDIISWVETNQKIDLDKAKQQLQNQKICTKFTNVTKNFIECYVKYYPFKSWGDTNDFVNIYVRVYRDGTIVTYVPHIDKWTLLRSLYISKEDNSVKLATDVILEKVLNALGIVHQGPPGPGGGPGGPGPGPGPGPGGAGGKGGLRIYHGTSAYRNAKYMEILWSNKYNLYREGYHITFSVRMGMYNITYNNTILRGFMVWLVYWPNGGDDYVYLDVYYNYSNLPLLWIEAEPTSDVVFRDMISQHLLNVGLYDYVVYHHCEGYCDEVYTQLIMVILLKG